MHFYVADPDDPIIRAYQGIFPTLFEPIDSMPADLRAHIRVPEELFNVQTQVFGRYHVTDPLQFFRRDDLWTVPTGATSDSGCRPRPTTSRCTCRARPGSSSCSSSRWSRSAGRT